MTLNILRPPSRWEFLRIAYDALHLLHQFCQLGAEAGGLGFVPMHDGVFKQRIQLLLACAGLPSSVRLCFGQPCSPTRNGRLPRPCDRSAYTYTPSGRSPALLVSFSWVPPGVGPKQSRAVHPRELGKRRMRSSLASGKSSTPPARCIHRPQRDTSSAEYRLLVSRASAGASREPESCRSPALIPHTCAVSPTFRYGAFFFVVFALADASSARLTTPGGKSVCVVGHR